MSKDITPAFYAIIPANVRYDKNLKPNAKLLFGEITALCNERGYCWAGNEYFANLYGVSLKTITTWVSDLVKSGYLRRKLVYKPNSKEIEARILRLPMPYPLPIKNGEPSPEKNGEGVTTENQEETTPSDQIPLPIKNGVPTLQKTVENTTCDYISEVFNSKDLKNYLDFIPLVEKWVRYKKVEKKQQYKSADTLKSWVRKLVKYSGGDFKIAEDIIETTMANLWEGIHEQNKSKKGNKPITLTFTPQNSSTPTKYGGF